MPPAPPVGLLHRRFQPHLDQMQHRAVGDPPGHAAHQLCVGNAVEVPAQVRIHYLPMSRIQQPVDVADRVHRAAAGSVGVLFRRQVGLEDGSEDQHRRRLYDTIFDRRDSQGPGLAVRLGDVHPPDRRRTVRPALQLLRQFAQPPLQPIRLDVLERLPVHARRSLIGLAAVVGEGQHVLAVHLVVQRVEPVARRSLRFGVQRHLQLLNAIRRC